jgi:hypothetical protein
MRINLSDCLVSVESPLKVDVHRARLIMGCGSQHPFSAPGVAEALYKSINGLVLTNDPKINVTYRNTYE